MIYSAMNAKKILSSNVNALKRHSCNLRSNAKISAQINAMGIELSARAVGYMLQIPGQQPTLDTISAVAAAFKVPPWMLLHPEFDASTKSIRGGPPAKVLKLAAMIHSRDLSDEQLDMFFSLIGPAVPDEKVEHLRAPSTAQPTAPYKPRSTPD